jgi:hypothetical protein
MVTESLVLEQPAPSIGLAVGLRTYLEIVKVEAPSEASYGTTVTINIYVKNKWTSRIFATVTGAYDTTPVTGDSHYIEPGAQRIFSLSFTMPNKSINLWIWAWYWTATGWSTSPDDEYGPVKIALAKWTLLASKTLTVKRALPPVVGWTLLASKTLTVTPSVAPPPVGWTLLASKTLTVSPTPPPAVGWVLLASKTVAVTAGPLPEWWELVHHYIDPWAYFYEGEAETAIAEYTLPPEEFPFTDDMAMKLTNGLIKKLKEEAPGAKLLEVKLYFDKAGPLWSRWLIEVTASVPKATGTIGFIIPWPLIIKGAIIIAILVLIYFIVKTVTTAIWGPKKLSEDVKRQWTRETLIGTITDLRPEYSPEALQEKSDQELRDILDKVYEEEVKAKGGWPWYVWLGITGIAVGGSFVAVTALRAFAPAKKEKKGEEKPKEKAAIK